MVNHVGQMLTLEGVQGQLGVGGIVLDQEDLDRLLVTFAVSGIGVFPFQGEIEGGALIDLGFGPDAAAVAVQDALHQGQADAGALVIFHRMQALEDAKQLVGVLHVEADAVIADEIDGFAVLPLAADFDAGRIALAGVLQRIAEQVEPGLFEQVAVCQARGQFADVHFDPAAFTLRLQFYEALLDNSSRSDSLQAGGIARLVREKRNRSSISRPICRVFSQTLRR